jgi:hypothetical protein
MTKNPFFEYFIKVNDTQGNIKCDKLMGRIREINTKTDEQRLNLLILRRVASEIFSAIIRTRQGTMLANVASIAQTVVSAKISYSLLHSQAMAALMLGNVWQAAALEGLAMSQMMISAQGIAAEAQARMQAKYMERVGIYQGMNQ